MQIGFAAVVGLLLIVGVVAFRSVIALTDSALWVQHTNEVLEHVAGLRLAMESVESGYRDFGLSGNDAYLRLSDSGKLRVGEELRILKEVTTDNAGQQFRLVGINDLARRIILRGDTLAREAAAKGRGLPDEGVPAGKDDALLEEFRIAARDLENEERRLLRGRSANGERRYRESKLALIVGGVLAVLIAAISGWMAPPRSCPWPGRARTTRPGRPSKHCSHPARAQCRERPSRRGPSAKSPRWSPTTC